MSYNRVLPFFNLILVLPTLAFAAPSHADQLSGQAYSALTIDNSYFVPNGIRAHNSGDMNTIQPTTQKPQLIITEDAPTTPQPAIETSSTQTWRARQGETIQDVLGRWASRENINLKWESGNNPSLSKAFSYVGTFDSAVKELMALYGTPTMKSEISE